MFHQTFWGYATVLTGCKYAGRKQKKALPAPATNTQPVGGGASWLAISSNRQLDSGCEEKRAGIKAAPNSPLLALWLRSFWPGGFVHPCFVTWPLYLISPASPAAILNQPDHIDLNDACGNDIIANPIWGHGFFCF